MKKKRKKNYFAQHENKIPHISLTGSKFYVPYISRMERARAAVAFDRSKSCLLFSRVFLRFSVSLVYCADFNAHTTYTHINCFCLFAVVVCLYCMREVTTTPVNLSVMPIFSILWDLWFLCAGCHCFQWLMCSQTDTYPAHNSHTQYIIACTTYTL